MKKLNGCGSGVAIHCTTEELANKVLKIASDAGYSWYGGDSINFNRYSVYTDKTCYILNGDVTYSSKAYTEREDYKIISAEEFIKLNSLKREEVYLELIDSETCKEIARILESSGESVYDKSLDWLKSGNMSDYPLLYYTENMWIRTNGVKERVKITIEELKELIGFKEMNTFKIGDRVKVINGGHGARVADEVVGTIISRGEVNFDKYHGELRETVAPIYVKCEDGKYYGLCDGYKLEHIKTEQTMKNQYIKCLSPEHGKRIIAYFEGKGFDNKLHLDGDATGCYYGLMVSDDRITCEGTLPKGATEIFLPEETKEESYTITRKALSEIYPLVHGCSKWRNIVEAILNTHFFAEEFTITKERVLEAYSEANPKQLEWLNKYLPKPSVKIIKGVSKWINIYSDRTVSGLHDTEKDALVSRYTPSYITTVELKGTYEVFE